MGHVQHHHQRLRRAYAFGRGLVCFADIFLSLEADYLYCNGHRGRECCTFPTPAPSARLT
jgi:hypothetical protein